MIIAALVAVSGAVAAVWVRGAGAGAGAVVAAVAVRAGAELLVPAGAAPRSRRGRARWFAYVVLGGSRPGRWSAATWCWCCSVCGSLELDPSRVATGASRLDAGVAPRAGRRSAGGLGALAWVAFKVGALSYGGGFVIVPLMQGDAVHTYHWMTSAQFLDAVALGQVTPGPVVATVAAVGYAAHGLGGGALAAVVAFLPSFAFVLVGGAPLRARARRARARRRFSTAPDRPRSARSSAPRSRSPRRCDEAWQFALLGAAAVVCSCLLRVARSRRGPDGRLLAAGLMGGDHRGGPCRAAHCRSRATPVTRGGSEPDVHGPGRRGTRRT